MTRTPLSRSIGQRSTCRGRGHIVATSRTVCSNCSGDAWPLVAKEQYSAPLSLHSCHQKWTTQLLHVVCLFSRYKQSTAAVIFTARRYCKARCVYFLIATKPLYLTWAAVYSCDGRVEVMIFKEEFKHCVEKLNAAINTVVATAQRKPPLTLLLFIFFIFYNRQEVTLWRLRMSVNKITRWQCVSDSHNSYIGHTFDGHLADCKQPWAGYFVFIQLSILSSPGRVISNCWVWATGWKRVAIDRVFSFGEYVKICKSTGALGSGNVPVVWRVQLLGQWMDTLRRQLAHTSLVPLTRQ